MKTGLLLAAAVTLAAGCSTSSGSAGAPYRMAAGAEMGINDTSASIRNRMNDIEVEFHRSVLTSEHQLAGLGDKTREMEDSARRSADRRSVIPR